MKKINCRFLSLMVIVAACLMTSCKDKVPTENEILNNIEGKWKLVSENGQDLITNHHRVRTFNADGTLISSYSATDNGIWDAKSTWDYSVAGNVLTQVRQTADGETELHTISYISKSYFQESKCENLLHPEESNNNLTTWQKVTVDYSNFILGVWEGVSMDGDQTFGDANHRWQYNADGSYVYFNKNADGVWEPNGDTDSQYFVDGDFLATRWTNEGVENREWWEIKTCNATTMEWVAIRERADGSRYKTTFTMRRIQ